MEDSILAEILENNSVKKTNFVKISSHMNVMSVYILPQSNSGKRYILNVVFLSSEDKNTKPTLTHIPFPPS